MSTALAPQGASTQLAGLPASSLPAPVDKKALTAYLAVLEDPDSLALQQRLAAAYDKACASLIGENDVQKEGAREFKKKSAWRKLGRYFAISTEVSKIEKEFIGDEFVATVTVRATSPWGQIAEAAGSCATDEATGRREISIADAIATAETRATNRAVSNLIAMGEVSAEELGERGKEDRQRPEMGLEEANGVVWPWDEPEKYVGKKLGDVDADGKPVVSTLALLRVQDWAQTKVQSGRGGRQVQRLLEAVTIVIDNRPDLEEAQAAWDAAQAKKAAKAKGETAGPGERVVDGVVVNSEGQPGRDAQRQEGEKSESPTSAPPVSASAPAPTSASSTTSPTGSSTKPATTTSSPTVSSESVTSNIDAAGSANSDKTDGASSTTTPSSATAEPQVQRASVELMTGTIFRMLADEAFAKNVRDRVRTRLANTTDLTADILKAAIAELEDARIPF